MTTPEVEEHRNNLSWELENFLSDSLMIWDYDNTNADRYDGLKAIAEDLKGIGEAIIHLAVAKVIHK